MPSPKKPERPAVECTLKVGRREYARYYFKVQMRGAPGVLLRLALFLFVPALLAANIAIIVPTGVIQIQTLLLLPAWLTTLALWLTQPNRAYRRRRLRLETPYAYAFYDENFSASQQCAAFESAQTLAYSQLRRAYETKHAFYLCASDLSYILPKEPMEYRQKKALRQLLDEKLGKKSFHVPKKIRKKG